MTPMEIIVELGQALLLILISPLMYGIVSKFKALMQRRVGSSIFQSYRDLKKLFSRNEVTSRDCSWLFRGIPYVCMASMIVLALVVPFFFTGVLAPFGDLITVVYIFTLYRFSMVLGGLEGGSTFGGMGSSREMMMSVLIEPALLLSIATIAVMSSSQTSLFWSL